MGYIYIFSSLFVCFYALCMLHICKCMQISANACSIAYKCSPQWGELASTLCSKVNLYPCYKGWSGLITMGRSIICTVWGGYALIYSLKIHTKCLFFGHKRLISVSKNTKLHVLHCQGHKNCTGSAQSYMHCVYVA